MRLLNYNTQIKSMIVMTMVTHHCVDEMIDQQFIVSIATNGWCLIATKLINEYSPSFMISSAGC